jgi:hypothetical protein
MGPRKHKNQEKLKGKGSFLLKKCHFPSFFSKIYSKRLDMGEFMFILVQNKLKDIIA